MNVTIPSTNNWLCSSTFIQFMCPDRSHPMHKVTKLRLHNENTFIGRVVYASLIVQIRYKYSN